MNLPAPPIAASSEIPDVLLSLFIVLLAAKLGDEVFKRLKQPTLIGEILAGVIIGPAVFGLVEPNQTLEVFAELGVVFLLFWVGLETRLSDLAKVGGTATRVGVFGMILPLIAGFFGARLIGESTETSLFVGAALVATSVGITSAVLLDLKALKTRAARTILGAAVIDDVLALVLLSIVVGIADTGGVDVFSLLIVIGLSLGFLVFVGFGGIQLVRRWPDIFHAPKFAESPLLPAIILCLGLAAIAAEIGLAAIIGAFLAGMIVAETQDKHDFEKEVAPLYAFFPPFFFAFIGLQVELSAFGDPLVLVALVAVTLIAALTKFAGAWLGARAMGAKEALIVGIGMIPRGEVGIIVAGIGLGKGVIDGNVFTVIVGMSVLTTLIAPTLLKRLLERP